MQAEKIYQVTVLPSQYELAEDPKAQPKIYVVTPSILSDFIELQVQEEFHQVLITAIDLVSPVVVPCN